MSIEIENIPQDHNPRGEGDVGQPSAFPPPPLAPLGHPPPSTTTTTTTTTGSDVAVVKVETVSPSPAPLSLSSSALLSQMSMIGPSDRCTPSQAQAMGQQLLAIIAVHERNKLPLPAELQNSFDIFHRCLAVVYGTFFLNLYLKANAPCLLCHGCKSLYPPGQFIHHSCLALPPNIVPCRSRMWRRCLVPLVSPGIDKLQQKQRWKYILEKFSHTGTGATRRNPIPRDAEAQILEMPECKRGRFVVQPGDTPPVDNNSEGMEEPQVLSYGHHPAQQNLLDVEPVECDLEDEDSSPSDPPPPRIATSRQPEQPPPPPPPPPTVPHHSSTLALAEQLVCEVRKLQQELARTQARLESAEETISKMPSEACMREQLAQALAMQQVLTVERDQAREQCQLVQEREAELIKQLERLRRTHSEMEKLFIAGPTAYRSSQP